MDSLRAEVGNLFSVEEFAAKKRIHEFDMQMMSSEFRNPLRQLDGGRFESARDFDGTQRYSGLFNFAFHRGGGFQGNADRTERFAYELSDSEMKERILSIVQFAREWREQTLRSYDTTILDLQLWDDCGTYLVEVKAPGDRLFSAQRTTIERARSAGRMITFKREYGLTHNVAFYMSQIKETFPFLEQQKLHGDDLMNIESNIIVNTMLRLIEVDVISFPIHDCLLVKKSDQNIAVTMLTEAMKESLSYVPALDVAYLNQDGSRVEELIEGNTAITITPKLKRLPDYDYDLIEEYVW